MKAAAFGTKPYDRKFLTAACGHGLTYFEPRLTEETAPHRVPAPELVPFLLYLHWRVQEHERERSQVQLVRLLAAAVDNAVLYQAAQQEIVERKRIE